VGTLNATNVIQQTITCSNASRHRRYRSLF
jgi:hypothetical protein